jgi:PAS domain S-box-containing protein
VVSPEKFDSTEFLHYLIKGMAEGVIFIDDQNITRLCNPVGGDIRGVSGDEIVGKAFLDCHPKTVHKKVLRVIDELKNQEKREVNRTVRLKGGFYEHSYSAVRDAKGRYLGIVAVSRDITERIKLEKDLKEHAKKLEYSNNMKDLFADIMRHDFINPASIIRNFADLLLDEDLPREAAEDATTIKRSSDRLIEMIETASKFSKLEDAESLTCNQKDLGKVLKKSVSEFQPFLKEKNIEVSIKERGKCLAEVSPFIGDVFANLISNAIKYSPEGSNVLIGIEDKGENCRISVADEADKISPEHRRTIFERFRRVGKEGVKGSGLGLAIVKRIVDLHKGRVWVEDNPVGGNVFFVDIPKKS